MTQYTRIEASVQALSDLLNVRERLMQTDNNIDTGLQCLIMIAKLHGINADAEQIRHSFAVEENGIKLTDIIRAAKQLGMKAKTAEVEFHKLKKLRLPAIIQLITGEFIILAKIEESKVLVFNPIENKPVVVDNEEFISKWNGRIILFSKKGFIDKEREFGFKWFIPSIWKYKKPLIEVLVGVFTLQILGLFAPIITQVVIDKVLVHKSVTTLDVMAFGLAGMALFETIMNIANTYVFTHTTSRIIDTGITNYKKAFWCI